jgi:predicted ATPase/DNA-binding SARP family transcriptional activator
MRRRRGSEEAAVLDLHLLGTLVITVDGAVHSFTAPPKTTPLLAFLLVRRKGPVSRDTLAFTLWPDEAESDARANVRRHLHHLQNALPPAAPHRPWLRISHDTVQWNPDADYCLDTEAFERLSAADATLPEAVDRYTGDLLPEVYDDWLIYERERLRHLYVADLTRLIMRCRTEREHAAGIDYAQRLLAHDSFHEDGMRHLMAMRYAAGDRAGALQGYGWFVQQLRQELAIDPMPETVALYEAILRNARLPGLPAPADQPMPGWDRTSAAALPFVGREAELGQLRTWWSRAARGRGGLVLVGGEAGVGKSRLTAELALLAEGEGARVLYGAAIVAETLPHYALVEALRSALPLVAALPIDPLWLAATATLLPELRARRPNLPGLPPLDPERERARLFEALARCLEGLTQPRPLLLLLEDLHWAGAASLAFLEFLAHRCHQHALLVVATYRDGEVPLGHPLRALRRRLGAVGAGTTQASGAYLALGRLGPDAVEALVARVPRLATTVPDVAHHLYAESEGHAFFLVELIRDLLAAPSGPRVLRHDATAGLSMPAALQELIVSRLVRLSQPAQALAELAAVAGRAFAVELVCHAGGWAEDAVLDAIGELLDHRLIREVGVHGGADYAFTHHLIQEAVYAGIPEATRRRRHRRVAQAMEVLATEEIDEMSPDLARHFDLGHDPARASLYFLRAARRALGVYADDDARGLVGRGLDLALDRTTRFDLLALREHLQGRRGEREAQGADLEELATLAIGMQDGDRVCEVLRRQILLQSSLGDRQAERGLIAQLKARAGSTGQGRWRMEALRAEAVLHVQLSEYDRAQEILEIALRVQQAGDEGEGHAECYCLLAEVAMHQGRLEAARQFIAQAEARATPATNRSLLAQTLRVAARAAFLQQDFALSELLARQLLDLAQTTGDREAEADACGRLASIAVRRFQVEDARNQFASAAVLYAGLGHQLGLATVHLNVGVMDIHLGRYAEVITSCRAAETIFATLGDRRGQAASLTNMSIAALYGGDFAAAQAAALQAQALAHALKNPGIEATALANLGAAELALGNLNAAVRHMEAGVVLRREVGQMVDLASDLCDLTIANLAAGDVAAARRTADEMLSIAATSPEPMTYPQYILWAASRTYRALGEVDRAQALLAEASAELGRRADAIPDGESRAAFLHLPFHRDLLAAQQLSR